MNLGIYVKIQSKISIFIELFPLFLIQKVENSLTRFYLFAPLLGTLNFILKKKISTVTLLLSLIFASNIFISAFNQEFYTLKRSLILALSFLFIDAMVEIEDRRFLRIIRNCAFVTLLFCLHEVISGKFGAKPLLDFKLYMPVLTGVSGYSNHSSSIVSALILVLYAIGNQKKICFLLMIPLILTWSRAGIFITGIGIFFIYALKNKLLSYKLLLSILITFNLLLPLNSFFIEKFCSNDTKLKIAQVLHGRFPLELTFFEVFKDNVLFGVGTDESHQYFPEYKNKGSSIISDGLFKYVTDFETIGPHNAYMKVLVENGIFGFLFFIIFLIVVIRIMYKQESPASIVFLTYLIFFNFLPSLSELSFLIVSAYFIKYIGKDNFLYFYIRFPNK